MNLANFLAAANAAAPPDTQMPVWANPSNLIFVALIAMVVFLFFSSSRAKRQEQKIREQMLGNLKRGDRVQTAGGILGTVVDVREGEIVLKVDESSNTKIKFSRDAVKRVITDDVTSATAAK